MFCSEVLLTRIVHAMGFAKSHSEARRLVVSGAVKLDDEKVKDVDYVVTHDDFASQTKRRLSVGKKKIGVLMW